MSARPASASRVAVVGGGWAGLAAAIRLADAGVRVELYEAARTLGGRARRVEFDEQPFDNGQHILIGAYRHTLALMRLIGVPDGAMQRMPLALEYPDGFCFEATPWPAPLHVLGGIWRARGLSAADKRALLRWMIGLRLRGYRVDPQITVAQWTAHLPDAVRRRMLDPLCISALNTPPDEASAQVFAAVLRDSLGGAREASEMILAQHDLGTLLPDQAALWLRAHGADIRLGHAIERLSAVDAGWQFDAHAARYDAVVLATPPWRTRALLAGLDAPALAPTIAQLDAFAYEPITTVYLLPEEQVHLPRPMLALDVDVARAAYGQFAFDRAQTGGPWGWIAVVVSASRVARACPHDALAQACARQLSDQLGCDFTIAQSHVITEKRATFRCAPGLVRPDNALALPGLMLAGDYTAGPYPATLEQAVRSGESAAERLITALR